MRLKLIIKENMADLVLDAETFFELEMLKRVENLNGDRKTRVSTEQSWGTTSKGNITVTFYGTAHE